MEERWTWQSAKRHKKGLTKAQAQKWAKIANKALEYYGDDAKAIKVANAKVEESKMSSFDMTFDAPHDYVGKTKKVCEFIDAYLRKTYKEYSDEKTVIPDKKYANFLFGCAIRDFGLKVEDLMAVGVPVKIIIDSLDIDACDAILEEQAFKKLYFKKKDGKSISVDFNEAIEKLKPYTKNYKTPVEVLEKANPKSGEEGKVLYKDVLKAFQQIYGEDIVSWGSVQENQNLSKFISLYLIEKAHKRVKFTEQVLEQMFGEAFERKFRPELEKLFPHIDHDYLRLIIQETKTVLDDLGAEMEDVLFPNINKEYLVHIKNKGK